MKYLLALARKCFICHIHHLVILIFDFSIPSVLFLDISEMLDDTIFISLYVIPILVMIYGHIGSSPVRELINLSIRFKRFFLSQENDKYISYYVVRIGRSMRNLFYCVQNSGIEGLIYPCLNLRVSAIDALYNR